MRVAAHLHDPRGRRTLLSVFPAPHCFQPGRGLHFVESWFDLLDQANDRAIDLVILDPWAQSDGPTPYERILILEEQLGERRVIPYGSPRNLPSDWLRNTGKSGLRPPLFIGENDDKRSLEQTLGRAAAFILQDQAAERLRNRVPNEALGLFLSALASWTPGQNVAELAKCFGMSEEVQRQLSQELALPPPREWLCWGRLFFGLGLCQFRSWTVSRLALHLGYRDRSSLCRMCRRLIGRQAKEVFGPKGEHIVFPTLVSRLTKEAVRVCSDSRRSFR